MFDAYTEERQKWIKQESKRIAPCLERHSNGQPKFKYTPASEQGPNYLREKFARLKVGNGKR